MLETLGLNPAVDYPTVEFLGNTGSVALPTTAALGIEKGLVNKNDRVALLGIGSGINVLMLGIRWQQEAKRKAEVGSRKAEGGRRKDEG